MKNKIFRLVTFTVLSILTVVPCLSVIAFDVTDDFLQTKEFAKNSKEYYIEKYGENYLEIFNANAKAANNATKITTMFENNSTGVIQYPAYFGGIYIDDNNKLVIQIVDNKVDKTNSVEMKRYNEMLQLDSNAKLQQVEYSYSELEKVQQAIALLFLEDNLSELIQEFYIDVIHNTVVVGLKEYTEQNIEKFKKTVIDSPIITFKKGRKIITSADIKAGGPINSIGCSVGYRARKLSLTAGNTEGFVTAGHCVSLNQVISGFGQVKNRQFGDSIDAAWINTFGNNFDTPVNSFYQYNDSNSPSGNLSTSIATTYTVGQIVGRVGMASKVQTGKITAVGLSFIYDTGTASIRFTDQVDTNVRQVEGDSGGVVYLVSNRQTMGIGTFRDENYHMTFSRADKINSAFLLGRY